MHGWRHVPRADITPQHCAVFPQLGAAHKDGFIDAGTELSGWDGHVFISWHAATELAKYVGYVPTDEHQTALDQLDQALNRVADLDSELAEVRSQLEAIDVIESAQFRARKKAGRPKVKETA